MALSRLMDDPQFQNYCKCMLALNMTRKALCAVVERKWKLFILKLPQTEKEQLETFVQCIDREQMTHVSMEELHLSCDHTLCQNIRLRLLALLDDPSRHNDFHLGEALSSDSCLRYFCDIAQLYIFEENYLIQRRRLIYFDIVQLAEMMRNCKLFAFEDYDSVLMQICDDRKYLIHSKNNKMTEEEMGYFFTGMKQLLAHFEDLTFTICTDTVDGLQQLELKDPTNEFQPIEFKLLVKKVLEIKKEALELDMDLTGDETEGCYLENLLEDTMRMQEQINAILDENEEDEVDELTSENERLNELVKRLKYEIEELKSENLSLIEESSMVQQEEGTDFGQEMSDMKKQLEWFKSELKNSKATIKRLEKERDRYRKTLEDTDQLSCSMETTAGGFTILSEKNLLYGRKVTVLQGDIVRIAADAIVHPTGKHFETRGAVGSTMKEIGGEVFLREVTNLQSIRGSLEISEVAICKGNNFPAEYVIHVHSPGWRHENAQQMLEKATANVLKLADKHHMKSIGIPSIGSGQAGFPKLMAAKTILSAITDYFSSNRSSSIKQVFFVLFDAESVTAYITELQRLHV